MGRIDQEGQRDKCIGSEVEQTGPQINKQIKETGMIGLGKAFKDHRQGLSAE